MNRLPEEKTLAVVSALVEGNSVRSTESITGVHRDTITRLVLTLGDACGRLLNERVRNVRSNRGSVLIWTIGLLLGLGCTVIFGRTNLNPHPIPDVPFHELQPPEVKSGSVITSSLNGSPQKPNLKSPNNDDQPCQEDQGFVPKVFDRVDRYWGSNPHGMLCIVLCYCGTLVLIAGGGIGFYDRGHRRLGVACIIAGCLLDVVGTFILGAPWKRANQPDCYKNQSAYSARFRGCDIVTQKYIDIS